jgi:hypothetical protein
MKPIYFPFTYVSDSVAQALAACFGKFTVYQPLPGKIPGPMQSWVDKGIMDVRVPVDKDQKELETIVKNYLSWANLHFEGSGSKPAFLRAWKDTIPFFSSSSSSRVIADIKEQAHGNLIAKAPDPVLSARIFLYFAQEFDRQNNEVALDLRHYLQKEEELIRELKMEDDDTTAAFRQEEIQMPDDTSDYMVSDRLQAWTRILLKDKDVSSIFITHIPAVLEELLEKTPTAEKLLYFESIPTGTATTDTPASWQTKIISYLSDIVENKLNGTSGWKNDRPEFPAAESTTSLSVYLVPDQMPRDFFSRCAGIEPPECNAHRCGNGSKNTLIGLIG